MKIFWIGNPFFNSQLKDCGFEVIYHNFDEPKIYTWQEIVKLANGAPDILVVADKSRPPFVLGQESFPCLTIFYAIDTHIHSYMPYYGQSFDLCLVSLKDHIPNFENLFLDSEQIRWFPAYTLNLVEQTKQKKYDCIFVGTVDPVTTPKRKIILDELKELVPSLHITRGDYRKLYPEAEIVLNISERGDLNFRVFEALGCNSCLLTQNINNGQSELFTHGEDLFTYENLDAKEIANALKLLLADEPLRKKLASNGLNKIKANHTTLRRAEQLAYIINNLPKNFQEKRLKASKYIKKEFLRIPYLHFAETINYPALQRAYLEHARL